jgi:DNA-binding response OmpR family regulator
MQGTCRQAGTPATISAPYPEKEKHVKKILIVEDDRKIALAMAVRLKANDYEAIIAFDAMAGVEMAVKHEPDLVILDISMPAGSGFDVAEKIHALGPTIGTPIIFMTASRKPEFLTRAAELGAVAFIEKPFNDGELLADVRHALGEAPPVTGHADSHG